MFLTSPIKNIELLFIFLLALWSFFMKFLLKQLLHSHFWWLVLTDLLFFSIYSQYISFVTFSSVQSLSRVWLLATPWIAARQAPGVYSNSCPLSQWCHPAISSSVVPFFSCPQSLQHQGLFRWVSSSHEVAKGLEFQLQHQSFQWTPRTDIL